MRKDNLTVNQGTTWQVSWVLRNPETRDLIGNFDGWSAKAQVRRAVADTTALWTWSTEPQVGQGEIELKDSKVALKLTPAQSSAWAWRDGVFSVEVTNPDGDVILISSGRIKVIPEVTRES